MDTTEASDPESQLREEYYRVLARRRLRAELWAESSVTTDDIIAEMKGNAHGPDLSPEYYEEMRRQAAVFSLEGEVGRFQQIIDRMSAEIRDRLTEKRMALPLPVFAAQFPHGSFNAQARPVAGGVLILINSGLFMFIHQMVKVATMATRFTDFNEKGELVPHPEIAPASESLDEITNLLTDTVLAYILYGDSTHARRLPALGGVRALLQGAVLNSCEKFALAHEYGHVIDGHFSDAEPVLDPEVESYIQKEHSQEYNADQIAAALLMADVSKEAEALAMRTDTTKEESGKWLRSASTTIAGPSVYFALSQLLGQVRQRLRFLPTSEPAATSTHPPAEERAFQIRDFIARQNAFDLSLADAYTEFFRSQIDPIVAEAEKRFREARPG